MAVRIEAPAKLNLGLRILGLRPDGYHELDTVFQELALHDVLYAARAPAGVAMTLVAEGSRQQSVPTGDDNLVVRAARAFLTAAGSPDGGARFHLRKAIPPGAGLGGGSSDAAAALLALADLCGHPLDGSALHDIACALGADVPFFLRGGRLRGTGTGTVLTPIPDGPPAHFVLIVPPFGSATAEVYKNHRARLTGGVDQPRVGPTKVLSHKELEIPDGMTNDLEAAAMDLCPELAELRDRVVSCGHPDVRMSGSGSTLFVACDDESDARVARAALAGLEQDGVTVLQTRSGASRRRPEPAQWPHGMDLTETGGDSL